MSHSSRIRAVEAAGTGRTIERPACPQPAARDLRLVFEYDPGPLGARVHVTNGGARAEVCGLLQIDGALAVRMHECVFATWQHTDRPSTWIPAGRTRTLHLANLDVSGFPYAQWELYVARPRDGLGAVRALHTSRIGGLPDTQAPPLALHLQLVRLSGHPILGPECRVVLEAFGARAY